MVTQTDPKADARATEMIREVLKKHPQMGMVAIAKVAGLPQRQVRRLRPMLNGYDHAPSATTTPTPSTVGVLTIKDIRSRFDVPDKIRRGIRTHLKGDVFIEDTRFRELCGVPISRWRRIADSAEFADNRMKIEGVLHWSRPETINEARSIMGLG